MHACIFGMIEKSVIFEKFSHVFDRVSQGNEEILLVFIASHGLKGSGEKSSYFMFDLSEIGPYC